MSSRENVSFIGLKVAPTSLGWMRITRDGVAKRASSGRSTL